MVSLLYGDIPESVIVLAFVLMCVLEMNSNFEFLMLALSYELFLFLFYSGNYPPFVFAPMLLFVSILLLVLYGFFEYLCDLQSGALPLIV